MTPSELISSLKVNVDALKQRASGDSRLRWARKILEREANGERVPFIAGVFAREALYAHIAQREPGEDAE